MSRAVIVLAPGETEIPAGIFDLAGFRRWAHSAAFPESGRIDWLGGRLEVDLAPEDLQTHGSPKSTIAAKLTGLIQEKRLGHVYIDRGRLTCPGTDLSVEPDVLVVLVETVRAGRARLVPKASGERGRYLEVEGKADLVVECVSDGSVRKDTVRLRELYHRAGVREYWLVDARPDPPVFELLLHQPDGFVDAPVSADGFRRSGVLAAEVRFLRDAEQDGFLFFRLDIR
jgi:Uma2 family endonuclease